MNINEQDLEARLRRAPTPKAPASLRKQLLAQISLPPSEADLRRSVTTVGVAGWLRRWWPALAPATVSLACGVVMAVQHIEIRDLKQSIQSFSQNTPGDVDSSATTKPRADAPASDASTDEQEEIARLKERAGQLKTEISRLEQTRAENENLRRQLASSPGLTAEEQEELDALNKARERAMKVACVNNMKQLGLAARLWENDNRGVLPPDILSMTNELNTPKILVCPADTNRLAAANWPAYTAANCSYEFLAPSGSITEPNRVMFRCPIHDNVGLCDGSVHSFNQKIFSERIKTRDGKLFFE